ncbi:MAG TPA: tRNA (guanosine(37)-N1)-methyltransferase TrmD [Patescibacteria group bacterium]|jgi:tRNA (guanine37-N1)-methyltransferase|nr:tRNA (guanosine(37)-N1)-methyltransferase TrmD [Patescibacteria group bacterium]
MNKTKKISISIITLFPEFIDQYAGFGIIARAIKNKLLKIKAVNLRRFSFDKRGTVDDRPYGGGLGMVLRPDVVINAIQKVRGKVTAANAKPGAKKTRVILMTPQGKPFSQAIARKLSEYDHLVFVSGRYEGFDERVRKFVDEEISIGDYVLMGGELPSLVITEAVLRLVPGVLGKDDSADKESFTEKMLEFPQYTKPEVLEVKIDGKLKKMPVPKVLLSGHHLNVENWRAEESLKRTKKRRPDLLK